MMPARKQKLLGSYVALTWTLLLVGGCFPTVLGPTGPSAYRVILPGASQTGRFQPLALTVRVTDAHGTPVEDVPVHFRIPAAWAAGAEINPPTVVTRAGRATATFRARATGRMVVEMTVEDLSATVHITVLGETPRF